MRLSSIIVLNTSPLAVAFKIETNPQNHLYKLLICLNVSFFKNSKQTNLTA